MELEGKPMNEYDIKPGDRFKLGPWSDGDPSWNMGSIYTVGDNCRYMVSDDGGNWRTNDDCRHGDAVILFTRLDPLKQYVTVNHSNGKGQIHKDKNALNKYVAQSSHQFKVYELGKELQFTKEVVWSD